MNADPALPFEQNAGRVGEPFVIFATPVLDRITPEYHESYLLTSLALLRARIGHGYIKVAGDCYLGRARDKLVHNFLHGYPEATHLFLHREEDVVAGVYPQKHDELSFPAVMDFAGEQLHIRDGLVRCLRLPTGFMMIRRHVLESLAAISPLYNYQNQDGTVDRVAELFRVGVGEGGEWYSEDYQFCNRVRSDLGLDLWMDPEIAFTHTGRKQYSGCISASVQGFLQSRTAAEAAA